MKRNKSYTENGPILYLIATPIGNLGEFSLRAQEIIRDCDIVAAEDTRNSGDLLRHFNLKKEMFSLREHNETEASLILINKIKEGKKVVYMSDAGYPCISDPGNILVKACLENEVKVSTISGSSAGINALVASGLDCSHYLFYGFLSSKDVDAKKELETLKENQTTTIFYESPHRIKRTLEIMLEVLGSRQAVIARELTKLNEEYIYGSLNELAAIDESTLKGEMVIIVEGNQKEELVDYKELKSRISFLKEKGLSNRDITDILLYEFKINKNELKQYLIEK